MRPPGLTIGGGPRTPEDLPVWRDCEEVPRQKLRHQYDEDHDEHAQCIHSGVRAVGIQHTSYEDDLDDEDPVCGSQQDDARPSLVPNDGELSHDENARAIESEQESEVERKEELEWR